MSPVRRRSPTASVRPRACRSACGRCPRGRPGAVPCDSLRQRNPRLSYERASPARLCGITESHLSQIERGRRTPTLDVLVWSPSPAKSTFP
ncbi:helix-turn-helix domain-containing protein [Streptomyces sp. NPDC001262]|uniref:helix-turn-helix domain-containing protein n=1 Tax=unclassified Streptomyces TaxID=2593676 RepID=UPI003683D2C9